MKKLSIVLIAFLAILFCCSCTKQITSYIPTPVPFAYPSIYNFQNVRDTSQKKVLAMMDQFMAELNKSNLASQVTDTLKLQGMFNNTGAYFDNSVYTLNGSGINLAALCTPLASTDISRYIDSIALYNKSTMPASSGIAGIATGISSKKYLMNDSGVVYAQLVKATLMEGLLAYQIEQIHLTDSVNIGLDTTTLKKNWDEAFGYWNVLPNFPTDTTNTKYWGTYAAIVNDTLGLGSTIMTNFLIGRAAISTNYIIKNQYSFSGSNYDATTDAGNIITAFDQLLGAAAIHELTNTKNDYSDPVAVRNDLSLAWAYLYSLKYAINPKVNYSSQSNTILAMFNTNFYNNLSLANIDLIKTSISSLYGFAHSNF